MPTKRSTGTAVRRRQPSARRPGSSAHGVSCAKSTRPYRARPRASTRTGGLPRPREPAARRCSESLREHNETSPELTGGDVDADWEDAYSVGDEAPGGDNPTPDQDRVDDIGKALGVEYQDNEPLKGSDKIAERDRHRWELDPASSEDYEDRD